MFQRKHNQGFKLLFTADNPDLIIFTGGADVDPSLYNEPKHHSTYSHIERDQFEKEFFDKHFTTPKAGICRGGQFLNVMSGGSLWQDVDNHTRSHNLTDIETQREIQVTSTHHQMMRPGTQGELVATAYESTKRATALEFNRNKDFADIEVVYYPDTQCLCFQPHPEYNMQSCEDYFFELLARFF